MTAEPLIAFSHVGFSYAGSRRGPALTDVSFAVGHGEAAALVGPNGAGKTTCLRLLTGLDHPTSGSVTYAGERIDAASMANRTFAKRHHARLGYVFQNPDEQLFCPTAREEVAFGPRQMGLAGAELQTRVEDSLALFGLTDLADVAPHQLSGGERRRLAVACIISMAPQALALDEPTAGLDQASYQQVLAFLRAYVASGKTVLVATHDPALVTDLGAREVRLA